MSSFLSVLKSPTYLDLFLLRFVFDSRLPPTSRFLNVSYNPSRVSCSARKRRLLFTVPAKGAVLLFPLADAVLLFPGVADECFWLFLSLFGNLKRPSAAKLSFILRSVLFQQVLVEVQFSRQVLPLTWLRGVQGCHLNTVVHSATKSYLFFHPCGFAVVFFPSKGSLTLLHHHLFFGKCY